MWNTAESKAVPVTEALCSLSLGSEDDVVKSKRTFRSQAMMNQNAETELMLEGDDDAVSLLQEKEIDNLAGTHLRGFLLFVVSNSPEVTEFKIDLLVNKCVPWLE